MIIFLQGLVYTASAAVVVCCYAKRERRNKRWLKSRKKPRVECANGTRRERERERERELCKYVVGKRTNGATATTVAPCSCSNLHATKPCSVSAILQVTLLQLCVPVLSGNGVSLVSTSLFNKHPNNSRVPIWISASRTRDCKSEIINWEKNRHEMMLEILEAQNCFFLYETLSCTHAWLPQNDMGMRGREASPGARSHPISESSVYRACRTHMNHGGFCIASKLMFFQQIFSNSDSLMSR